VQIIHQAKNPQSPLVEGFALVIDVKAVSEIIQQSLVFSIKWWCVMCG
jgi:hypothetical protein